MFVATTQADVISQAQNRFRNLRQALNDVQDLHNWSSGQSVADLQGIGFSIADAELILGACADANQVAVINSGGDAGTYTLPFDFSASQTQVIGP